MKLAISNIAWQNEHESYYQLLVKNNFDGLEIAPTKFTANPYDYLPLAVQIKQQMLQKYNLKMVSMQSLLFGTDGLFLFNDKESRNKLKDYLKKAIIYAKNIDCPLLVFGNPKNRVMQDPKNDYLIAIEFFSELGQFAIEHNTCLCIEPNPTAYGTNFINTLDEASQLVKDVRSDGFGMIIDTSTMLINQESPELAYEALANAKHIHISMPFLKPLNHEYPNYKLWLNHFFKLIKSSDYDAYISIEMVNASYVDVEISINILLDMIK